jgi:hypothetical protein
MVITDVLKQGFEKMTLDSIDLTKAKHQLITLPALWLCVIFVAGWTGKIWIAEAVGLTPRDEHKKDITQLKSEIDTVGQNVNVLTLEIRVNWAYQMLNTAEANLAAHLSESDHSVANWEYDRRQLEMKVKLSNEYKTCVISNGPNCSMIQRQILQ